MQRLLNLQLLLLLGPQLIGVTVIESRRKIGFRNTQNKHTHIIISLIKFNLKLCNTKTRVKRAKRVRHVRPATNPIINSQWRPFSCLNDSRQKLLAGRGGGKQLLLLFSNSYLDLVIKRNSDSCLEGAFYVLLSALSMPKI